MFSVDQQALLERFPGLEDIALAVPSVGDAVRSESPHRIYRALQWASLLGRVPHPNRAAARALLDRRHLFWEPLKGAPSMFTLNGIGTRVYETGGRTSEGLQIGNQFLVFVFVPVLPLGAYLYKSEGKQFRFFARLPLGGLSRLWQLLVFGGGALCMLGVVSAGLYSQRNRPVWVVNALPVPVSAHIGELSFDVPAGEKLRRTMEVGTHPVVVRTEDGEVLERGDLLVATGADVTLWNVGGLAPVFSAVIPYAKVPTEEPRLTPRCGERSVSVQRVDYVFREPPETISLPSGSGTVRKTQVDVDGMDWHTCAGWALGGYGDERATATLQAALAMRPLGATGLGLSVVLGAPTLGYPALADALAPRLQGSDDTEEHRIHQSVLLSAGRRDQALDLYRQRHEARPDDLDATYLFARLLPPAEALTLAEAELAQAPEHPWLRRTHFFASYQLRHFDVAAEDLALMRGEAPAVSADISDLWVETFAAIQRYETAAEACAPGPIGSRASVDLATGCRRLRQLSGLDLPALDNLGWHSYAAARAGEPVDLDGLEDGEDQQVLDLMSALQRDPDAALRRFRELPELTPDSLDDESALTIFGLAAATGDSETADRLRAVLNRPPYWTAALAYVETGLLGAELDDCPHRLRAPLLLMRSRMPGLADKERRALRDEVAREDLLHGLAWHALRDWPT